MNLARLSPLMKRALLREREGRLPLLEAGLKAEDEREARGAERTKMALIARGLLVAAPFRCELTPAGQQRLDDLRKDEERKAMRAAIKAQRLRQGPHPRWGEPVKTKAKPRWGAKKGKPRWKT